MACVTKKKGRWCVDFYDQHWKRRLKMMPKGATKNQAMDKLEEIRKQVANGVFLTVKKIPTFNEISNEWLEHKKRDVREHTWDAYECHTRRNLKPHFGRMKVTGIKFEVVEAVMSGARQGELIGLQWSDVDWYNSQIHIKRTFQHGRFYDPKSATSKRKIDLGPTVMKKLKKWKIACMPTELDLVFPSDTGTSIDNNNLVRRHYEPALRRAGLRRIKFHCLRHTYGSLLIDQGEHPKYIQNQMGHSSINVTMDTYGHLMKTVNQDSARRLDGAIFEVEKEAKLKSGDQMETKGGNEKC